MIFLPEPETTGCGAAPGMRPMKVWKTHVLPRLIQQMYA